MAKQLNVALNINANTSQAQSALTELQKSLTQIASGTNLNVGSTQIEKASAAAKELAYHLNNAYNAKTGNFDLSKLDQSLKSSNSNIQKLSANLLEAGETGQQAFVNLANSIAAAEAPALRINSLFSQLWTVMKNTARWQLSSSLLHGFIGTIETAYNYAKDLNESLNNIRIVTGQSVDEMADFAVQANKAAKALSTTTTAYTDAALIFYQQGLTGDDVTERTNTVIKLANVTGQSAEDVSSNMTAIWNNFADGSHTLEYYADAITALGASTASSSSEIAEGLEKFASVADTVGLSYEYATSALATVVAKTRQSADIVGTAFKTIFARLSDLELGNTLDDNVTLGTYSQALEKIGVNILDVNNNVKDMDTILDETAAKWDKLSTAEQESLAQTVAGTRQYTQFISLMDNWQDMQKNVLTATDSSGTLQNQADIYAESWDAASNRVRASLEDLYSSLIDDKFFISLTNSIATIVDGVDNFIEKLGGVKPLLIGIFGVISSNLAKNVQPALENLKYNFTLLTKGGSEASKRVSDQLQAAYKNALDKHQIKEDSSTGVAVKQAADLTTKRAELARVTDNLSDVEKQQAELEISLAKEAQDTAVAYKKQAEAAQEALNDYASPNSSLAGLNNNKNLTAAINSSEIYQDLQNKINKTNEDIRIVGQFRDRIDEAAVAGDLLTQSLIKIAMQEKNVGSATDAVTADFSGYKATLDNINQGLRVNDTQQTIAKIKEQILLVVKSLPDCVTQTKAFDKALKKINSNKVEDIQNAIQEIKTVLDNTTISGKNVKKALVDLNNSKNTEKIYQDLDKAKTSMDGYAESSKKAKAILNNLNFNHKVGTAEALTQVASSASSFTFALQSLQSAWSTLNDEEADGLSKLTSITMAFSMLIPAVNSLQKSIITLSNWEALHNTILKTAIPLSQTIHKEELASYSLKKILTVINTTLTEEELADIKTKNLKIKTIWKESLANKNLTQTELEKILTEKLDGVENNNLIAKKLAQIAADWGLVASENAVRVATLGVVGVIALVVVGLVELIKYIKNIKSPLEQAEEKLDNASSAAADMADAFDQATSAVDNLKSSIENYNSTQDALDTLVESSTEWKEALLEANNQVLQLLDSYPQLAEYLNSDTNGRLTISSTGFDNVLNDQLEALDKSESALLAAKLTVNQAQQEVDSFSTANAFGKHWVDNNQQIGEGDQNNPDVGETGNRTYTYNIDPAQIQAIQKIIKANNITNYNDLIKELNSSETIQQNVIDTLENNQVATNELINSTNSSTEAENALTEALINSKNNDDTPEATAENLYYNSSGLFQDAVDAYNAEFDRIMNSGDQDAIDEALNYSFGTDGTTVRFKNGKRQTFSDGYWKTDDDWNYADTADTVKENYANQKAAEDVNNNPQVQEDIEIIKQEIADLPIDLSEEESKALLEGTAATGKTELDLLSLSADKLLALSQSDDANLANKAKTTLENKQNAQKAKNDQYQYQKNTSTILSNAGVTTKEFKEYQKTVAATNKNLADQADLIEDIATRNIENGYAISKIKSAYDDVDTVLVSTNKNQASFDMAVSDMQTALSEIGINISADKFKDDNFLTLIKQAANGSAEALKQLRIESTKEQLNADSLTINGKLTINGEEQTPTQFFDQFAKKIDEWTDDNQLEIGATLDDDAFYQALQGLVTAGVLARDQIKSIFESIGFTSYTVQEIITEELGDQGEVPVGVKTVTKWKKTGNGSTDIGQTKSTGSKKDKKDASDEIDRYHEIEAAISNVTTELNRLSKAKDQAYGQQRLNYLDQEIEKNKKLIALNEQLINLAKTQLTTDKQKLEAVAKAYGITNIFNPDTGEIDKYQEIMTAALNEYNSKLTDAAAEKYDNIKDLISDYEEDLSKITSAEDAKIEEQATILSNNYEKISYKLELTTKLAENELTTYDYYFNRLSDDFYTMAEALGYLQKEIQRTAGQQADYQAQFDRLKKSYEFGLISQADYIEGLQDCYDAIYDNIEAIDDYDEQMKEYYGDTLSKANEELENYTDNLEHLTNIVEQYQKIQELTNLNKDYSFTKAIYKAEASLAENQYNSAIDWYNELKSQGEEIIRNWNSVKHNTSAENYEFYKQQYLDYQESLNEAEEAVYDNAETFATALKDILSTTIEEAFTNLEDSLSGLYNSFDSLNSAMQSMSDHADEYLTNTNKLYETNKLINQTQQAISKTDNVAAKQKYAAYIDEIKQLQQKDELSNLELKIAQAKYTILEKQIALEEAQNAKSTVRLTRDEEGNYGYVYTADTDKISNAEQELADAENELYNIQLDATNEYGQKREQAKQELVNKLQEIEEAYLQGEYEDEKAFHAAQEQAKQEYYDKIEDYTELYVIAQQDDSNVVTDAWVNSFEEITDTSDNWKANIEACCSTTSSALKTWQGATTAVANATKINLDNLTKAGDDLETEITDYVVPAIGDELQNALDETTDYLDNQRDSVMDLRDEYLELAESIKAVIAAQSSLNGNKSSGISDYSYAMAQAKINGTYNGYTYDELKSMRDQKLASSTSGNYVSTERISNVINAADANPNSKAAQLVKDVLAGIKYFTDENLSAIGFRTGGYTGNWGTEGKLAILHEKELVLNEDDTSNILQSVEILRSLISAIDKEALFASLGLGNLTATGAANISDILEQNVTITAEFPNATNHSEIEEAFNSLINRASQYANRY